MAVLNRILSALLALALLLGGLLGAVEIALALAGQPPWLVPHPDWASALEELTWEAPAVRAVLAGLVLLGLLLLVPALRRGKPGTITLPARSGDPSRVTVRASRRGIERTLAQAARQADGVASASVGVSRRAVSVQAVTTNRTSGDLRARVQDAVGARLAELGLSDTLRTRVRVITRESR